MSQNRAVVALDVGEKRIGVAVASGNVRIAIPLQIVEVNGSEIESILRIIARENAAEIIVGYPRNQSGGPTAQTDAVEAFVRRLKDAVTIPIKFQDESLTSIQAETELKASGRPYSKGDIDAQAAAIFLQDYLETTI